MLQDFDPMHNIPRDRIVSKRVGEGSQTGVLIASVLMLGLAGFFFWGMWVDDVVPDKYVFAADAHAPDRDYLASSRR